MRVKFDRVFTVLLGAYLVYDGLRPRVDNHDDPRDPDEQTVFYPQPVEAEAA